MKATNRVPFCRVRTTLLQPFGVQAGLLEYIGVEESRERTAMVRQWLRCNSKKTFESERFDAHVSRLLEQASETRFKIDRGRPVQYF